MLTTYKPCPKRTVPVCEPALRCLRPSPRRGLPARPFLPPSTALIECVWASESHAQARTGPPMISVFCRLHPPAGAGYVCGRLFWQLWSRGTRSSCVLCDAANRAASLHTRAPFLGMCGLVEYMPAQHVRSSQNSETGSTIRFGQRAARSCRHICRPTTVPSGSTASSLDLRW